MSESTDKFFQFIERQNAMIAANEAASRAKTEVGVDPIRLQREQELREKYGELRAREKSSNRPVRTRRLFGYIDLS